MSVLHSLPLAPNSHVEAPAPVWFYVEEKVIKVKWGHKMGPWLDRISVLLEVKPGLVCSLLLPSSPVPHLPLPYPFLSPPLPLPLSISLQAGKSLLTRKWIGQNLDLALLASTTVTTSLFFRLPSLWHFATAAQADYYTILGWTEGSWQCLRLGTASDMVSLSKTCECFSIQWSSLKIFIKMPSS